MRRNRDKEVTDRRWGKRKEKSERAYNEATVNDVRVRVSTAGAKRKLSGDGLLSCTRRETERE